MNIELEKKEWRQQGYTLVEALIVLAICIVIIAVSITTIPRYAEKREMVDFLEQLSRDIHYIQAYNNHREAYMMLLFDYVEKEYIVLYEGRRFFTREIPESIEFRRGTLGDSVVFSPFGHTNRMGSWRFNTENYTYKFTILIGRGRHYYEEI